MLFKLLLDVVDVGGGQRCILIQVLLRFAHVLQSGFKLLSHDISQCYIDTAKRINSLDFQGLLIVLHSLLIVFPQPINISQSVVRAVIVRIDPDALLEPMDGVGHVVFVVIGDPQTVVRIVVARTHRYARLVPLDRLFVVAHLVVNASQTIVRVLIRCTDLQRFLVALYGPLVIP